MGIHNSTIDLWQNSPHNFIDSVEVGGSALSIGTQDFLVTPAIFQKYDFQTFTESDVKQHHAIDRNLDYDSWMASSKELCVKLFAHFGYDSYQDMDINRFADHQIDLCHPVDVSMSDRYDLILDSSVPYISNPIMGYQNLIRMLKLGGKLQTSSFINQPNRALLNPEPNFLEDYLRVNGMTIISHFIHGKFYRYICDYDRNKRQKTWQLYDVIPPEDAFGYYFAKLIGTAHICDRQLAKKALKIIRKFSAAFYNDPKLLGKHNVLHNTIYAQKIAIVEEIFPIKDVYQQM